MFPDTSTLCDTDTQSLALSSRYNLLNDSSPCAPPQARCHYRRAGGLRLSPRWWQQPPLLPPILSLPHSAGGVIFHRKSRVGGLVHTRCPRGPTGLRTCSFCAARAGSALLHSSPLSQSHFLSLSYLERLLPARVKCSVL